ncbi:hypothetical protein KSS93_19210 [Pseudomonas xanthosomatis]|uniref:hypothetical protein n=1 Tax=Pseudomonas xanthosomatis TaxID=2842356 RepID=UPI001C3C358E|nr:hypothetical protein [Pseudomonas xanthosomatis]QXH45002.1 hypothetical protein KSS93_19210 [Pseudomonas xanthosomatis]
MDTETIKQRLARPATRLIAGGFRPAHTDDESWLGRVFLFRPDEGIPLNSAGEHMLPYAQLFLPGLSHTSSALAGTRVLTLFISRELPDEFEPMGDNWLIREYGLNEVLVRKELAVPGSFLKPFPLKAEVLAEDYPLWEDGGIPLDVEEAVHALEKAGSLDSYHDLITHCHEHKIGGYPSYCQAGVHVGDGFEFVLQISSDPKINLNVVHGGSLMFWKHPGTGQWAIYYDFY